MEKQNEILKSAITHVSSLAKAVDQGQELDEMLCGQVLTELEELRELYKKENKEAQNGMVQGIEELLTEFNSNAEDSKGLLQEMLSVVSEGRVPKKEDMLRLDASIACLTDKYNSIYALTMAEVSAEEMPEKGRPALEYVEAVRNSASTVLKKQMEEIRQILQKFIAVRSLMENYAVALEPFQKEAKELFSELADKKEVTEEVEQKLVGPRTFIEALECEDIDSDAGMNLVDRLGEYYPLRVANGVSKEKYYISDEPVEADTEDPAKEPKETTFEPEEPEQEEPPVTETDSVEEPENTEPVSEEPEEKDTKEDEEETKKKEDTKELSPFADNVQSSGLIIEDMKKLGDFSHEDGAGEDKKISVSVFQNDLRTGYEKATKLIISRVCAWNTVTLKLLCVLGIREDIAKISLEYLMKKGYLRRYQMASGEGFYCASPRLQKAIAFKDAAKWVGVRRLAIEDWGEPIEDSATGVVCRTVAGKIYADALDRIVRVGEKSSVDTTMIFTEAFVSKLMPKTFPMPSDLSIAAFWSSTKECDRFLEALQKMEKEAEKYGRLIVSALDVEKAAELTELVRNSVPKLTAEKTFLYSYKDGEYYTYPEREKVSALLEYEAAEEAKAVKQEPAEEKAKEEPPKKEEKETEDIAPKNGQEPVETPVEEAPRKVSEVTAAENRPDEAENVISLINVGRLYAATAYARAYSLTNPEFSLFCNQLSYALNDPLGHCVYSTATAFSLLEQRGKMEDAMVISAAIRTFFSNQVRYDYDIRSLYDGIKEYKLLNDYPSLSKVVYSLMEYKAKTKLGMDAYADYHSKSEADVEKELRQIQQDARIFYENVVVGRKKEKASQKRFLETKKLIFAVDGDFGQYIKAIADGDNEMMPLAIEFLQTNFYKDDSVLDEETIDEEKLWEYITVFWEKAGDTLMYRRHADLVSHLRTNIIAVTTKAIQLMVRWCNRLSRLDRHQEDDNEVTYKKARKPLIDNLEGSIRELTSACVDAAELREEQAGIRVLLFTLEEILACIKGTYNEYERKYFYKSFLLTDDVMLDENYLPDLGMHSTTITLLSPVSRILYHALKCEKGHFTFDGRLKEILNDGDDYGQGRLIISYLRITAPTEELDRMSADIESGEVYAKETAALRKDNFIGDLELAQSYGQIDNSVEDKKEKILQITDEWFEWANETSNYGFFKRVMDSYIGEIKEAAKVREKDLLAQLEGFKSATIDGLSVEAKVKRAEKIQKMIQEQNYTVAEDLLARADGEETEYERLFEEDYLKEFLRNYDDYYQPVASHQAPFATLVSNKTRNKEERGAKRLSETWLPGGSRLGKERLMNLLTYLGFNVEAVSPQNDIGKYEHYYVKTKATQRGHRENYPHPIAAFGSEAETVGFRVVCVNGLYDADGLIEIFNKIGNTKHTLLLADEALTLGERRRLARKSKSVLGDKFFGVVDRVVMMCLIRNFDETQNLRRLISLITPFGYYQPYVWESANVMPPEIFMGRKIELEKIKAPTGVNIVYGGRQLGKSALLKKAKEDIDNNENGDRAVLVDIKGLDYKKAANKVGHELYDAFVLDQDINTEDWSELARAVKRRLQSGSKTIPYLLLLLDEADVFIESCASVNYQPLDALKDIQGIGAGRFKFVIAGLRNIVRFNIKANAKNSVLPHLEAMTVRPFTTTEARELLEIPLHYLGLRFPKEKLITLILATTNYFPGLIQMYCAKLIEAMREKDYAKYDEVDTPIYEVSEEHIKKVLADSEFTKQIREKFDITLKLDEDNYYDLIALLMSYLYHNNGYNDGYSAEDIKKAGEGLGIEKISKLEINKLEAFMEELMELNVLRKTENKHYLFTRFTFFQMMGTSAEVDDALEKYMGD